MILLLKKAGPLASLSIIYTRTLHLHVKKRLINFILSFLIVSLHGYAGK